MDKRKPGKVTVLRTQRCRKSDVVIRFLKENNIPHEVKILESDEEARDLAQKHNIMASPGIIIGNKTLNPYELVEHCQVKNPATTKETFLTLLRETE